MNANTTNEGIELGAGDSIIRTLVRGIYDIQKLRIQMGNRIAANFRSKLGQAPGKTEEELEKQDKKILDQLRASYARITDGIVDESGAIDGGKIPTPKKFKGDEIISTYAELVLMDEYMSLLKNEESQFKRLGNVLEEVPIYTEFLSKVKGIGPAMAGVIVSEIDIRKAEYPSSLWMYSGLDCVTIGVYTDDRGTEHRVPIGRIDAYYKSGDPNQPLMAEGKYPVQVISVARSRKAECLVDREYVNKDKEVATRKSITYNPFLKTKLMGVLAPSFLRGGVVLVNGNRLGAAKRMELAKSLGYDPKADTDEEGPDFFLKGKGYRIETEYSEYAQAYYNYRHRLDNDSRHKDKTASHKHNMALRFMVKRFLVTLYNEWRRLEGLAVAPEYSEAKLGKVHGQA